MMAKFILPSRTIRGRVLTIKKLIFTSGLLLFLALTGCGYHTAGKAAKIPTDIRTIAIPVFINNTQNYRIEQVLTAAVVREFNSRTNYRVVNSDTPEADATLRGSISNTYIYGLTYDPTNGRQSSAEVVVYMRVQLVDRHGKTLFENPNYMFREEYEFSLDPTTFFREETPALDRLSQDFARTLVSNILENY